MSRDSARRIVSLVPSLTEALFVLGLGDRVVGITDFCVHPAEAVSLQPRVGGTKNPSISAIRELEPDLVIANQEENRRQSVEALRECGIEVWVTYPRTVRGGAALLREIAELGASAQSIDEVVVPVERAVDRAEAERPVRGTRVFCPIWKNPWMAVGGDTYASDLIALCGGENVFADHGDRRYPVVAAEDIVAAAPDVVLLPDEPYAFGAADAAELSEWELPAARQGRIHVIDGTLASWYGPRIARAVETLCSLLRGGEDRLGQ